MIKLILFDYGGVLGSDADEWDTSFKQILKLTGLTSIEMQELFEHFWPDLKTGKIDMHDFWKKVREVSKNKIKVGALEEIYREKITVNKKVLELASCLKQKGYQIAILANESKEGIRNKIQKFGLDKIFDKVYCSADLGTAKPDTKAFEIVLNDFSIGPDETLFIDNLQRNVESAKKLNINVKLYEDVDGLRDFLKSF